MLFLFFIICCYLQQCLKLIPQVPQTKQALLLDLEIGGKMLLEIGLILGGNMGLILRAMLEKLNAIIAQKLSVEEYSDLSIILLDQAKIQNLVSVCLKMLD